jgi:hypothetical protein
MMACAFIVVCGLRIYEEFAQQRWVPVWRTIIGKYEAAALRQPWKDEQPPSG